MRLFCSGVETRWKRLTEEGERRTLDGRRTTEDGRRTADDGPKWPKRMAVDHAQIKEYAKHNALSALQLSHYTSVQTKN